MIEQQRIKDERDGLAVLKKKVQTTERAVEPGRELKENNISLSDVTIYLRHLITCYHGKSLIDTFNVKAKVATISKRYSFISTPPVIPATLDDFFVEFEVLVNEWRIETPIAQEDGRPFAYEVDRKMMDAVYDQAIAMTLVPYDIITTLVDPETGSNVVDGNGIGGFAGSLGLDSTVNSLASISGAANKAFAKGKMSKVRNADWLNLTPISPNFDLFQAKHRQILSDLKDMDMELKLEYDILLLADIDQITAHLKDTGKRIWKKAASVPNCRPLNTKVSIIPQSIDHKNSGDPPELRHTKQYDFSFEIPKGNYDDYNDFILKDRKVSYGMILKANEDTKKLEIEIANADPTKVFPQSNYISPTIASVFAEHEVLGFCQLRYIKIRDYRNKILRQLNFFRSIEKRIVMDCHQIQLTTNGKNGSDPNAAFLAEMWLKQEFFELSSKAEHNTKTEYISEDIRGIIDDRIYITDKKGTAFIYDIAVTDLQQFDEEMIKVLTAFINSKNNSDGSVNMEYLDELRFKTSNRNTDLPNITFRNPDADRIQLMLEYYESYHDYFYAKIQLINCYMEVFENTINTDKVIQLSQIICQLLLKKPEIDFQARTFSKSFTYAKHSVLLHTRLVEEMIHQISAKHREWVKRYQPQPLVSKSSTGNPTTSTNNPPNSSKVSSADSSKKDGTKIPIFFSTLKYGLPEVNTIENIIELSSCITKSCEEAVNFIGKTAPQLRYSHTTAECVILKLLNKHWDIYADHQFKSPVSKKGLILESDSFFTNPYLPDAILKELYLPFDQTDEGNFKSLEIHLEATNAFNDPSFTQDGVEILYRLLKALTLDIQIDAAWMDTENNRKVYESQLSQIEVKKANYCTRMAPLKFDFQGASTKETVDEDREDENEPDTNEMYLDSNDQRDAKMFKYGPLAIMEVDDSIAYTDVSHSLEGVLLLLKVDGIKRLKYILKVQLLEKHWLHSAVQLTNLILIDHYTNLISPVDLTSADQGTAIKTEENANPRIDFGPLLPTAMNQKKLLRKTMLSEYSKEYKALLLTDYSEYDKDIKMKKIRSGLIDFYFNNMLQVTSQEVERAEFSLYMSDFRMILDKTTYAPLIFSMSRIQSYADYISLSERTNDQNKSGLKQPASTQGLNFNDTIGVPERLARLWYIPHDMAPQDRPFKGNIDQSTIIFKNSLVYMRSGKIYSLIFDIFNLIASLASLLQGNSRYTAAAADIREADYIVNTLTMIKRDFQAQGENADYNRVLKGLTFRWQFWILKWKAILGVCSHCLSHNLLTSDVNEIENQYDKTISNKMKKMLSVKKTGFEKPLKIKTRQLISKSHLSPANHLLTGLSHKAKLLCDIRIAEIEEELDEFSNIHQSESKDEVKQKLKIEFVTGMLRLLRLRKSYARICLNLNEIPNEEVRNEYYSRYKIKIAVPSIKLYQKGGKKGGLSQEYLLRDATLLGPVGMEFQPTFLTPDFNRIGRAAFDKCQQLALQTEIMRDFTQKRYDEAKEYFDRLTDERMGRLFRASDNTDIQSVTGLNEFAFKISDDDYTTRSNIFNDFLAELFQANQDFALSVKSQKTRKASQYAPGAPNSKPDDSAMSAVFDDRRIFACKKTDLATVVINLAVRLNKWKSDRSIEHEKFFAALNAHLIEMIKNCEKIIIHQSQEKREQTMVTYLSFTRQNFQRDCRLQAHEIALDAFTAMASMEVELIELRKNRKVDEKRIRNRILEEYDSLVDDLVREIGVLRNRFREYQISNFNEVMVIMSESKKERLLTMEKDEGLTTSMRDAISTILKHDAEMQLLQVQNSELRMTVSKIRSMFTMKEQGLKSFFTSKIRRLTEVTKETESRLWDSFRDGEARERALRKQLTRLQKAKSSLDVQNDLLQRQLLEEQGKSKSSEVQTKTRNGKPSHFSARQKRPETETRFKRHDGVNVEKLLNELSNKTILVEELLQEKRDREKSVVKKDIGSAGTKSHISSIQVNEVASAAEPANLQIDVRSANYERLEELESENRALRRKLFLNGISLPPESKKSLSHCSTRLSNYASSGPTPNRSRPRTAITAMSSGSRPRTAVSGVTVTQGILKSSGTSKLPELQGGKQVLFSGKND
ncbi:hypothetical protein HDV02_003543 [Globomyces sp. JEL0801]|nr:hypothetical protein HDV02_003543 [Globomyces sp. JEL0801]